MALHIPTTLPPLKAVRDLLADLLGREVAVEPGIPLEPQAHGTAAYAVYVDERLQVVALVVIDLPLAASVGAAIGLIPAPRAEEAVEGGQLGPDLRENLYEVCNIMAALFNVRGAPHLKLYEMWAPREAPPTNVTGLAAKTSPREDVAVDVSGYGAGTMSIVLA